MARPKIRLPRRRSRWATIAIVLTALAYGAFTGDTSLFRSAANAVSSAGARPTTSGASASADATAVEVARLFRDKRSGVVIEGRGAVERVLRDDLDGSRHQRFILRLAPGQTLLVSHNIDLAPRVDGLRAGDTVAFRGQYEWNERGGVVHWTHHDPGGRRPGGWLKHAGVTYR